LTEAEYQKAKADGLLGDGSAKDKRAPNKSPKKGLNRQGSEEVSNVLDFTFYVY